MPARTLPVTTALLFLLAAPASAQSLMEAGPDKDFIAKVTVSNTLEIETSRLARSKSTREDVKTFAQAMIDDHTKASESLKKAVREANGPELAEVLDGSHQTMLNDLSSRSGAEFDKAYIDDQIALHNEAVSTLTDYAKGGAVPPLKTFAERTLPVVEMHRTHILAIAGQ